jgi:hypothetical protein
MRRGDLVLTEDGYYGILATDNSVFLGNGCEEIMDAKQMAALKVMPINVFHEGVTAASNFLDLVENRAPCQESTEQRRQFSRDICGNE